MDGELFFIIKFAFI